MKVEESIAGPVCVIEAHDLYCPFGGLADIFWVGSDFDEGKKYYQEQMQLRSEANHQQTKILSETDWLRRDEIWLSCLTDSEAPSVELRSWFREAKTS